MIWLLPAVGAYVLLALNVVVDKFLLSKSLKTPAAYAFFIGAAAPLVVLATPFLGFPLPSILPLLGAIVSGMAFVLALLPYYAGLQKFESSRIVPATGGLVPVFSLVLGALFFGSAGLTSSLKLLAFFLAVAGSVCITIEFGRSFPFQSFVYSVPASVLFAVAFVLLKYAYVHQTFWSGLLWSQLGQGFAAALIFICVAAVRSSVVAQNTKDTNNNHLFKNTFGLIIVAQLFGASGVLLQHIAIYIAPEAYVPFVNALQGVQYVCLLIFALLFTHRFPQFFGEKNSAQSILQKWLSVIAISVGILLMTL